MTVYFVSNAGSNTAPYDTEAKAATTLGVIAALPWTNADTVKVSSTHTETAGAAISYTLPTTVGLQILSVTFNGSGTGGLAAGGAINVGAANAGLNINSGFAYVYGLSLVSGTNNNSSCSLRLGATGTLSQGMFFDTCTISTPSAHASAALFIGTAGASGNDDAVFSFVNCTISQGAARSIFAAYGRITFDNMALAGTAPTTVFDFSSGNGISLLVTGSDLSGVAWTNLANAAVNAHGLVLLRQCKLRAGFTIATGAFDGPGSYEIILSDCDSGDVHYSYIKHCWSGVITTSASIYADASDGTNSFSLLMVGNANTSFTWPLVSPQIAQFNSTLSALTSTVEVTNDGTTFTDAQLWQETLAKITAGSTQGTWNRGDRAADILTAGANQATSTKTWTGTGGFGAEVKQTLVSGSFIPAEVGPIVTVVKLAANDNVYVSPKVAVA